MKILVTGGAGYIGSHTCVELLNLGHDVVIFDNLSNSSLVALDRINELSPKAAQFIKGDVLDKAALGDLFSQYDIDAVIHFAGLKAVGESVEQPLRYYQNNVVGTLQLCEAMIQANVFSIIFSSSATVYGDPASCPITESFPLSATNPYGWSKLMVEQVLTDIQKSDPRWNMTILRYFNPVGAHRSGRIGEDPSDIPNNLMPFVTQVAVGKRERLSVFGGDYPTADGTGVRDYIHVVDLAKGHIAALDKLQGSGRCAVYNLGTGHGYSVLDLVKALECACGKTIPYEIVARRAGDVAQCYSDASLALAELAWKAEATIEDMAEDSWRWQEMNPDGYR
jgi:UDP-glucose 4-epimerase